MRVHILLCVAFFLTLLSGCHDNKEKKLVEYLNSDYQSSKKMEKVSSGSKAQYIQMEKMLNKQYVKKLAQLSETSFDRQLEKFEDEELGVWNNYMYMIAWVFQSQQEWDDKLRVLSDKYFNTLDIQQELHTAHLDYIHRIRGLRQQFIAAQSLPSYTKIELPKETVTLGTLQEHTRNNIAIEIGSELLEWLLGLALIQLIILLVGIPFPPVGCIIDVAVFIIILPVSIVISSKNDDKLLESLKSQHSSVMMNNQGTQLESLDRNTTSFYEHL